jgi:hypothetical protein
MIKKILTFLFVSSLFVATAQSSWEVGGSWGRNSTEILNRNKDSYFARRANSTRWNAWGSYSWSDKWAVKWALSREDRGWKNWRYRLGDSLLPVPTFTDYTYRFWVLTTSIEYRTQKGWYVGIGLAPMYQTSGDATIRLTGEKRPIQYYNPSSLTGTAQFSGLVSMGRRYPICTNIDLYGEMGYSVSFKNYEMGKKGYHDAYNFNFGVCYQL